MTNDLSLTVELLRGSEVVPLFIDGSISLEVLNSQCDGESRGRLNRVTVFGGLELG